MWERFFSLLGRQLRTGVNDVLHSEEFQDLKQNVHDSIHDAVDGNTTRQKRRRKSHAAGPVESVEPTVEPTVKPLRYSDARFPWKQVSSLLLLVFGGFFGITAAGLLIAAAGVLAAGEALGALSVLLSMALPFGGLSAWMLTQGCRIRGRLGRIRRYLRAVGSANFCPIDQLAPLVQKSPAFVAKDLDKMIRTNMLPDGYLDEQKTCLMLGEQTYQQYLQAQRSMEERERREAQEERPAAGSTAVTKGRESLRQIRLAKDFITDETFVLKIDRLENVTEKILNYVERHPEKGQQIRKFNDYYLPTTVKLLTSYCQFDRQPVQGENITSAKKQIRDSLDTINTAFENLLDSLFGDATLDISSDISVLEVMLAREGLTGTDFKKDSGSKSE